MDAVEPEIHDRHDPLYVAVPARRAGVARRRLRRVAQLLHDEGYELSTVDPSRDKAAGTFSVAKFERSRRK